MTAAAAGEQLELGVAEPPLERPAAGVAAPGPTPEQRAAIDSRAIDVLLEAGAGTGKTRVLVDRYVDAVDLDEIEPERILAFTFTEKAAAEMRRRARVELGRRAAEAREGGELERAQRLGAAARAGEAAPITTIHGFCRRLLATHPAAAGLDPRFRVLDAEETARVAAAAFDAALEQLARLERDVARLAAAYRRGSLRQLVVAAHHDLRNHGFANPGLPELAINLDSRLDQEPDPEELALAESSYRALRTLLDRYGERFAELKAERSGVDFDDLQLLALELLVERPAVAAGYRERFRHLLVDELQDTSPVQIELVRALAGPETRVFAVGDEFQSIYAFRGADLESFRAERERGLRRQAEGEALVLPLSGSFRSTPDVVAAVNALGAALLDDFRPLTVGREPDPDEAAGGVELLLTAKDGWAELQPELRSAAAETPPDRIAEARFLAARLRELVDEEGVDPAGVVVLLRAFTHVDAYAEALELAGLDPYVVGGRGYWSNQQVEDGLQLLACVTNPLDDEPLLGALASPACALSPDGLWILRRIAGRGHIWPAVERLVDPPEPVGDPAGGGNDRDGAEGGEGVRDGAEGDRGDGSEDPERAAREREAERWSERLPEDDRSKLERFHRLLGSLREAAPLLALDELVERVLDALDYELAALGMNDGRRRAANLAKLIRIAADYERREGRDLRGFLRHARDRAALGDRESAAAVAAEDHAGVRVMTVHAAKGLEFDTVAVADLGRGLAVGGRPPDLRLSFPEAPAEDAAPPQVGLRLARAGAGSLALNGIKEMNDEAAAAEAAESSRLAYVAASRARRRLLLSGVFAAGDLEPREQLPARCSALARLLPSIGATGADGELLELPAPHPRAGLVARFAPGRIAVRVNEPGAEAARELGARGRAPARPEPQPAPARPPMLALAERGGAAARSLSYAALADYQRCGYRFLVERVLGLGERPPTLPAGNGEEESIDETAGEWDEPAPDPGPEPDRDARTRRLGFGRAVHSLLEWSARNRWIDPGVERVRLAIAREGGAAVDAERARELVSAWLAAPLLGELRDRSPALRPEVPFRLAIGAETVIRGTVDLLATGGDQASPLLLDYKTDALGGNGGVGPLAAGYELQRSLYALAVAEATGAERVRTAYVFLERADDPVEAEFDRAALAAARERIGALIAAIRDSRFEVTDAPHRALCHDCPARPRLCSHPPELTLAPSPPEPPAAAR